MRQAGLLPLTVDAERFADYLLTLGIKTRIDTTDTGRIVWIKDEKDLERGRSELAAYVANPADAKYKLAEDGARTIRKELEARDEQYRKNLMNVRRRWAQPITGRAPFTMALMGLSIAVAILTMLLLPEGSRQQLKDFLQITSITRYFTAADFAPRGVAPEMLPEILHGQLWRLVTPILVHSNPLHILFNMLMLQNMGTFIETREGTKRFVALVLISAVLSNLAQCYFSNVFDFAFLKSPSLAAITSNPNFGGMSGVNYALFGYLWLRSKGGVGYMLHPNTVFMMIFWMILCMAGLFSSVANTAHGVGLIVGVAAGWLANRA